MSLNGKHQPIKTIHEKKWQQIGKFVQWKVVKNFYEEISKYNNYKEEKALKKHEIINIGSGSKLGKCWMSRSTTGKYCSVERWDDNILCISMYYYTVIINVLWKWRSYGAKHDTKNLTSPLLTLVIN